ncbi:hypothetical protein llap_19718 [Limosa lapponica baueri]|uniref:Uncharacterized protein n=1 Tax=Limosa lapponica baueri TaxID=1758121 RepID=A0A2I0T871_LIMLA|nr:hypothetical protein llap_19718 [Limosa lapponica baueri]
MVMLLLGIPIIHDKKNNRALKGMQTLLTIPQFGHQIGYLLARDLAGYCNDWRAREQFSSPESRAGHHWWWVPLTALILGSLAGVLIHKLFIDFHNQPVLESENEKGQPVVETSTL